MSRSSSLKLPVCCSSVPKKKWQSMPRRYVHFNFWGNISCCEVHEMKLHSKSQIYFLIFSLLRLLVQFYYFPLLLFLELTHPVFICPCSFLSVFLLSSRSNFNFQSVLIPLWMFLFSACPLVNFNDPRNNKHPQHLEN